MKIFEVIPAGDISSTLQKKLDHAKPEYKLLLRVTRGYTFERDRINRLVGREPEWRDDEGNALADRYWWWFHVNETDEAEGAHFRLKNAIRTWPEAGVFLYKINHLSGAWYEVED